MDFSIPMSYPLIDMAMANNNNLFFSAFSILVGAHYLPFIYGYGKVTFGVLGVALGGGWLLVLVLFFKLILTPCLSHCRYSLSICWCSLLSN
jgi:hypothetical protein